MKMKGRIEKGQPITAKKEEQKEITALHSKTLRDAHASPL